MYINVYIFGGEQNLKETRPSVKNWAKMPRISKAGVKAAF